MQLEPEGKITGQITSIDDTSIVMAKKVLELPIALFANNTIKITINNIQELNFQDLTNVIKQNPELVIIGTGKIHQWPSKELFTATTNSRVNFEFMSNSAAVSTYNLLLSENRNVACVLLIA